MKVNDTTNPYPLDENGDPTLEYCLQVGFGTYYLSAEVGAGFQCLYDNHDGLWDSLASYWLFLSLIISLNVVFQNLCSFFYT